MKRLFLLLGASALAASPGLAQHEGHNMPGMAMPMPAKKPPAKEGPAKKKQAVKKAAPKKGAPNKRPAKKPAAQKAPPKQTGHEGHDMSQMPGMEMPQQGRQTRADQRMQGMPGMQAPSGQKVENMPGMQMPSGEHAGHDMAGMKAPAPPVAPPPSEALKGPENAADAVFGAAAMAPSRNFLLRGEHGRMTASKLLVDQLETRLRKGRDGYFVNAEGWIGGDIDKLWLKSEIEGDYGRRGDQVEFQALYSHAIDPWFNLQAGVRLDALPRTRGRLVLGVEGLAPYWWEVSAAAFVSDKGDITARAEAYHDVRITQKLILQPRAQLDFALQDIEREGIGSGLSKLEAGVRLRYQVEPKFAPYVGLVYERAIGRTARFRRADGEDPGGLQFTVGLRTWF